MIYDTYEFRRKIPQVQRYRLYGECRAQSPPSRHCFTRKQTLQVRVHSSRRRLFRSDLTALERICVSAPAGRSQTRAFRPHEPRRPGKGSILQRPVTRYQL